MLHIEELPIRKNVPDILLIKWLDYDPFMKHNFESDFFRIIDQVKQKGIENIVLDSSHRRHDPSDKDYIEIFELFFSGLSDTGLKKFARICSPHKEINLRFQKYLNDIKEDLKVPFEVKNFNEQEDAMQWLEMDSDHNKG